MIASSGKRATIILLAIALLNAGCRRPDKEAEQRLMVTEAVLINTSGERCEVASLLQTLARCKTAVIGVDFIYPDLAGTSCDTLLRDGLSTAGNCILIEGFQTDMHLESHDYFQHAAYASGLVGLVQNADSVMDQYYFASRVTADEMRHSFPLYLALGYLREPATEKFFNRDNKPVRVNFGLQNFEIMEAADVAENCSRLSGKIILLGDLYSAENSMLAPSSNGTVHQHVGTVVMASVALEILKDLQSKTE